MIVKNSIHQITTSSSTRLSDTSTQIQGESQLTPKLSELWTLNYTCKREGILLFIFNQSHCSMPYPYTFCSDKTSHSMDSQTTDIRIKKCNDEFFD